jgi:hypothetical protein
MMRGGERTEDGMMIGEETTINILVQRRDPTREMNHGGTIEETIDMTTEGTTETTDVNIMNLQPRQNDNHLP